MEDGFCGFSSFYIEINSWWRSSFNYYFLSKAAFGEMQSVQEVLKDHCDSYFDKFSGKAYEILSALLFEVRYTEEPYAAGMSAEESIFDENEKIFSRIEKVLTFLEKEIEKDSDMSLRLTKGFTHT